MRTSDSSASIWLWPRLAASPSVSNTAFATATPSANVAASAACAGVVTPAPTKTGEPLASRTRWRRLKDAGLMGLAREMSWQGRVSSEKLAAAPGRFLMCMRATVG